MNRICPFNQRTCGCDPDAANEDARPCVRSKRAAKFVAMLGSSFEGEQLSALRQLGNSCRGKAVHSMTYAAAVQDKQIHRLPTHAIIYEKGMKKGRAEEARKQQAPPEFYDADGQPRWHEIAAFCQQNSEQLRSEWEHTFVNDMAGKHRQMGRANGESRPSTCWQFS